MHTRARDDCRRRRTAARVSPQAHLGTRVARSKSENRQQASALRRPPAGSASGTLAGGGKPPPPSTPTRPNSTLTPNANAGPRSTSPDIVHIFASAPKPNCEAAEGLGGGAALATRRARG
ncbi:hypothetical protein FIBSPDRAFT_870157 [Athelia psychrophila]|uniref:Uncharacterized protein n=1 Tax=Athelia psychrophila TaxID=1759441 RepID=A0A166BC39_9AGAM|nr:hypothetical protein FIBSPDRAFT_870157 [Fibularhizoctonia sp. CBS 109695]